MEEPGTRVFVPAFSSRIGYPEVDIFASSYLSSQLLARGCTTRSNGDDADLSVVGTLLSAHEELGAIQATQTFVELVVSVRVEVYGDGGDSCTTPIGVGRSAMTVWNESVSEADRLVAVQVATVEAIDSLLLDILLCTRSGR